jgi:hypothetical protein
LLSSSGDPWVLLSLSTTLQGQAEATDWRTSAAATSRLTSSNHC